MKEKSSGRQGCVQAILSVAFWLVLWNQDKDPGMVVARPNIGPGANALPVQHFKLRKRLAGVLALLLLAGVVFCCLPKVRAILFAQAPPPIFREVVESDSRGVVSTKSVPAMLPAAEVTKILRCVRQEMRVTNWRDLRYWLSSWSSFRMLPNEIRSRLQERISEITVMADQTVEVWTIQEDRYSGLIHAGATYRLEKRANGWLVTQRGCWIE